ncbi:hypothetical protein JR316_0013221 [Psilocybe cubensis]|uniref:Uncharacterized protein n=1 Tax=Psilocybe cubensis TaxID=181762 RepID=A0ACB8GGI5_PSICU|nr:hypothetical protein JR316_0013221 [Psilocybe cubensis]KAH9474756.1 hypothetical protein JR316_0013221 [Psilocybe cubensis]
MKNSQKKTAAHKGSQPKTTSSSQLLHPNQQLPAYTTDGQSNLVFAIGPEDKDSVQTHPNYTLEEEAERILMIDELVHDSRGMHHDSKVAFMNAYFQRCNWQSRYETFMKTGRDEVADKPDGQSKQQNGFSFARTCTGTPMKQ